MVKKISALLLLVFVINLVLEIKTAIFDNHNVHSPILTVSSFKQDSYRDQSSDLNIYTKHSGCMDTSHSGQCHFCHFDFYEIIKHNLIVNVFLSKDQFGFESTAHNSPFLGKPKRPPRFS